MVGEFYSLNTSKLQRLPLSPEGNFKTLQEDKNQITQRFQIFHSSEIAGAGTTAGNISWLKIFLDHKQETNIFRFEARTSVTKWQLETGVVGGYRHQQWCRGAAISTQHLYGPRLFCLKRLRHYKGLPFNVNMWTKRLRKRRRRSDDWATVSEQKQRRFGCLVLDYRQCDSGSGVGPGFLVGDDNSVQL